MQGLLNDKTPSAGFHGIIALAAAVTAGGSTHIMIVGDETHISPGAGGETSSPCSLMNLILIFASSDPVATSGASRSRTPVCETQEESSVHPYAARAGVRRRNAFRCGEEELHLLWQRLTLGNLRLSFVATVGLRWTFD